jgi:type I restriction enzyme S subunit
VSWPQISVDDFCLTGSGGTPSRKRPEYYEGDIPWIKSGDLRENTVTQATEFISDLAISKSSAKIVPKGAILLAMYGATVGRMAMLGIDATTNQAVCNIVPDVERAFPKYVYYALLSKVPDFLRNAVGGAQPNINQGMIKNTKIPLPPLKEQKRIAAILDKADNLRRKRQQAIQLADEFLRAVFLDMFGDPVTNPKGWDVVSLGDHLEFVTSGGRGWAKYYSESGPRFIRSLDVQMNSIGSDDPVYVIPPNSQESKRTKIREGDVLLTITGSKIGRASYVPEDFSEAYISQHVAIIRTTHEISSRFLSYFLSMESGGQRQISNMQYGQTKPGLNLDQIRRFKIPKPSVEKQNSFISLWEMVDSLADKSADSGDVLRDLSLSFSQKAFTGQL